MEFVAFFYMIHMYRRFEYFLFDLFEYFVTTLVVFDEILGALDKFYSIEFFS